MATAAGIYGSGVMPAKEVELLSIAFDASYTHMYAPGTRRHIRNALQAGATMKEITEVLKLCVAQGIQACNLGVPILAEELARHSGRDPQPSGGYASARLEVDDRPRSGRLLLQFRLPRLLPRCVHVVPPSDPRRVRDPVLELLGAGDRGGGPGEGHHGGRHGALGPGDGTHTVARAHPLPDRGIQRVCGDV